VDIWWSDAQPVDPGCRFHRGKSTGPRRRSAAQSRGTWVPHPRAGRRVPQTLGAALRAGTAGQLGHLLQRASPTALV